MGLALRCFVSQEITTILNDCRRIAAFGIRRRGSRSYEIARFLSAEGYEVIPIGRHAACRHKASPSLAAVSGKIDMVAVFSGSADPPIRAAVEEGISVVWIQPGSRIRKKSIPGVRVIRGRCLRREYLSRWPPMASLSASV